MSTYKFSWTYIFTIFRDTPILSKLNDFSLIKKSLTELYSNLPYITLSGARELEFNALSDLTAKISYLLKSATRLNIQEREESHAQNAYNINKNRLFVPKRKIL